MTKWLIIGGSVVNLELVTRIKVHSEKQARIFFVNDKEGMDVGGEDVRRVLESIGKTLEQVREWELTDDSST